jgi:3-oxoacyl-[acyl-carrier protein] reductase
VLNKPKDCSPGHAVVTGSSSGIGQAIAEHLLASGWRVTGLDASAPVIAHEAFTAVRIDLTDRNSLLELLPSLQLADALIHAAGVLRVGTLGQLDDDAGTLMWQLHVEAATVLANGLLPAMAERGGGRLIFIGSRVSQGMPGRSQYACTKAALVALARSWAAETVARQVTVNVISPAATQTSMLADPGRTGSTPRVPPLGRYIQPAEIAALAAFLLSPAAAAITGQDIAICGGSSLPH